MILISVQFNIGVYILLDLVNKKIILTGRVLNGNKSLLNKIIWKSKGLYDTGYYENFAPEGMSQGN